MNNYTKENRLIVLKELIVRLSSYFDILPEEAVELVGDVVNSLLELTKTLKAHEHDIDHPSAKQALNSIFLVINRLNATQLDCAASDLKRLHELPEDQRAQAVEVFASFLNTLSRKG